MHVVESMEFSDAGTSEPLPLPVTSTPLSPCHDARAKYQNTTQLQQREIGEDCENYTRIHTRAHTNIERDLSTS